MPIVHLLIRCFNNYLSLHAIIFYWVASNNPTFDWKGAAPDYHKIYEKLTNSLLSGKFNLDIEVKSELIGLSNPYDYWLRKFENVNFPWDTAYFNGNFYCYFGILPVLLFYLPFYFLTGEMIEIATVVFVVAIMFTVSCLFLTFQLRKRYFPNISFKKFIMLELLFYFGTSIIVYSMQPSFYAMVIVLSLSLICLGLGIWIKASTSHNNKLYILGSVFMSLVLMARPSLLLSSVLVIPFAIKPLIDRRKKENEKINVAKLILINTIPYIIVGVFVMHYNYARFGNVFDFGANYNLTSNDMTHRPKNLVLGIIDFMEYLFQVPKVLPKFPFINTFKLSSIDAGYVGYIVSDFCTGGYFWLCPASLTVFLLFSKKFRGNVKQKLVNQGFFKYKEICLVATISIAIGIFLVIFDGFAAGILFRYYLDFSIFFALPSVILLGVLMQRNEGNSTSIDDSKQVANIEKISYALVVYTVLIWAFSVMSYLFN